VVVVAIDGNDPRLMPDLSAAVDVDVDVTKQNVGTMVGPSATGSSSNGSNSNQSPAQNPRSGS
jgi:hypothetical protein